MHMRIGACLLALAGCVSYGKAEDDDDDPPGWSWMFGGGGGDDSFFDDDDEWYYDYDYDASDPSFGVSWGSSAMNLEIEGGGEGSYYFGMAETGCPDPGSCWYGEDCVYGDVTGTYFYCHPANPRGTTLQYTTTLDLSDGYETLLDDELAAGVTYYAESYGSARCWTWGHDPSYYAGLGCEEI